MNGAFKAEELEDGLRAPSAGEPAPLVRAPPTVDPLVAEDAAGEEEQVAGKV